jgi:hydrogenase nickel incorporation protein HypA/HybF
MVKPPSLSKIGIDKTGCHSMIMACSAKSRYEVCMHEGVLTEDLFEHVLIHARDANARHVTRVKVTIGSLSDYTAESIQFYWDSLAPGTIAEGAVLEFDTAPGTGKCNTCGEEFEITEAFASCPKCGAFPVKVTAGNGVYLSSLEVETDGNQHAHIHE